MKTTTLYQLVIATLIATTLLSITCYVATAFQTNANLPTKAYIHTAPSVPIATGPVAADCLDLELRPPADMAHLDDRDFIRSRLTDGLKATLASNDNNQVALFEDAADWLTAHAHYTIAVEGAVSSNWLVGTNMDLFANLTGLKFPTRWFNEPQQQLHIERVWR